MRSQGDMGRRAQGDKKSFEGEKSFDAAMSSEDWLCCRLSEGEVRPWPGKRRISRKAEDEKMSLEKVGCFRNLRVMGVGRTLPA